MKATEQFGKSTVEFYSNLRDNGQFCMNCRFSTLNAVEDYQWHTCEAHHAIVDSLYHCELFERYKPHA